MKGVNVNDRFCCMYTWNPLTARKRCSRNYGWFTLHGNGTRTATGNWTSTIGNNEIWFLSLSFGPVWTFLWNISVPITVGPIPCTCHCPVPVQCEWAITPVSGYFTELLTFMSVIWVQRHLFVLSTRKKPKGYSHLHVHWKTFTKKEIRFPV